METCAFCGSHPPALASAPALPAWALSSPDGTEERTAPECVQAACEACLTWMHELDTRVAPVLRPLVTGDIGPRFLAGAQRATVAAWTWKTILLLEFRYPGPKRYFTAVDREQFRRNTLPPTDNTAVWLSSCNVRRTPSASDRLLQARLEEGPSVLHLDGYTCTLTVGQVALQVLTFRAEERPVVLDAVVTRQWLDSTLSIWPTPVGIGAEQANAIAWPPLLALDDAGVLALSRRWDRLSD